jgi:hypothetical protein
LFGVIAAMGALAPPAFALTTVGRTGSRAGQPPLLLLPSWAPDYQMRSSTMIEPCSSTSEYFNASFGAQYGIISYDWSGECDRSLLAPFCSLPRPRPPQPCVLLRCMLQA